MEIIDLIFNNLMNVFFPVAVYLIYICYKKSYSQKENDLAIVLLAISILYVVFKFNNLLFENIPFMIVNLSLIISFYKKTNLGIVFSIIISVVYYYLFYENYLFILIIFYCVYYIIYLKINGLFKINIFITTLHTLLIIFLTINSFNNNYLIYIYQVVFSSTIDFIIISLIIYIINQTVYLLKLHLTNKELVQEAQIKNSLFQITHEIKNPIAVCKGYLDMFDVNNKKHAEKYIPIIKEEVTRTLYLLEDFLSMNKIKIKKDIVDINLLLEEIKKRFSPLFKEKNIIFSDNLSDEEIYIYGDYNRLVQVFINIIKNSVEAIAEKGKIDLNVKINNDKIFINIKDNGSGISKENLKHIKEVFYTTKVRGTGLGVSLSDEIIKAHGGKLNYSSQEGKFTLVMIELPIIDILNL